ncbi:MAG: LPS export ABC transporter periplasmic protein LptC [Alphaproteobacteria bacterium]|nr:LPS export ABC transporter periplasmic protein LptC [Alphaproteobacteria bacterium]
MTAQVAPGQAGAAPPPRGAPGPGREPVGPARRPKSRQVRAAVGFHSRLVGFLKLTLPLIAGALVVMVAAWPHLYQREDRFKIGVSNINIEEAATVKMVKPRYTGIDAANRPYVLTADDAVQQATDSNVVELNLPKGDVTLSNGSWVALTGETGHFYKDLHILDLSGQVNMFHDAGYEFRTATARFDMAAGSAEGNDRVDGQGPFGSVVAEGFRVVDKGAVVHFLGKSRLVIRRDLMAAPK